MKNIIIKFKNLMLMGSLIFLFSIIGCVSLDEEPLDFPSPENFYGTEGQIVSGLTGSMGRLYSQWSNYSYPWGAEPVGLLT